MSSNGTEIMAEGGPDPVAAYPHARRVGNLLFISGLGPHRKGEMQLPVYAEYLGEIRPTRTTLQVAALPRGIHIELKAIAAFSP